MSDTPAPEESEHSDEVSLVVEAIGEALFCLLSDESFTEEETESFVAETYHVAHLALGMFQPKIIETSKNDDGSETFTFQMTVPAGDLPALMKEKYSFLNDVDWDDEDDDDDDDDSDE